MQEHQVTFTKGYQVWVKINPRQESMKNPLMLVERRNFDLYSCVIFVAKKTFQWEVRWESSQYRYDWIWRGTTNDAKGFSHGVLQRVKLDDG